jgi:hypothetical protein
MPLMAHIEHLATRFSREFGRQIRCRADLPASRHSGRFAWTWIRQRPSETSKVRAAFSRRTGLNTAQPNPLHGFSHDRWRSKLRGIADLPGNGQTG